MFPNTTSAPAAKQSSSLRNSFRVVPKEGACTASAPNLWRDYWNGPVVATASAVGALVLSEQHGGVLGEIGAPSDIDSAYQGDLSELIVGSMHWLARRQRQDGGWSSIASDAQHPSDLFTSMIVRATFRLTGAPAAYPELGDRMVSFINSRGGAEGLKATYGPLHSATLLARGCSALAEVVDWKQLPAIPIETANFANAESRVEFWSSREDELPAVLGLGIAGYALHRPLNPLTSWRRAHACRKAIDWLCRSQEENGSFGQSVPVTSLVLMCLASTGHNTQPIVRRGVEYLFAQVNGDGSWPAKTAG